MGNTFAIELGTKVTCSITGMKGTITARIEYDTGCRQYQVMPKAIKNKVADARWIDEVHVIDSVPKPKKAEKKAGGWHADPPERNHP